MRNGLRVMGAMAMSLVAPHVVSAQSSSIAPPPPGTPVAPFNVPAHVLPQSAPPQALISSLSGGEKPAGRKVINNTNAQIDYRIDSVGPSGIGRVDIYLTSDRGSTWTKVGEDADKQSPANVSLPGEGLFGVRLAIVNGNGFGGKAPRAGDRPQFYVEVDATSPAVTLLPAEMAQGAIDVRWTATDANLAAEPVSIFVRSRPDLPWQTLAQNVKNDGTYRWNLPPNVPPHIFMKLEVVDLAGNKTTVETPTPITLDQTEPEATVLDATPINRGPSPANVIPVSMPTPAPQTPAVLPPTTMPPALPALPPGPIVPRLQ